MQNSNFLRSNGSQNFIPVVSAEEFGSKSGHYQSGFMLARVDLGCREKIPRQGPGVPATACPSGSTTLPASRLELPGYLAKRRFGFPTLPPFRQSNMVAGPGHGKQRIAPPKAPSIEAAPRTTGVLTSRSRWADRAGESVPVPEGFA